MVVFFFQRKCFCTVYAANHSVSSTGKVLLILAIQATGITAGIVRVSTTVLFV